MVNKLIVKLMTKYHIFSNLFHKIVKYSKKGVANLQQKEHFFGKFALFSSIYHPK